jgi:hypothetical protein
MVNLSAANLIGGFVFGSIGFVAFIYGKRMNLWKPMLLGIALMVYPYFISDNIALFAVGILEFSITLVRPDLKKRSPLSRAPF